MAHNTNAQRNPDPASFPQAAHYAFSPYALAFDEYSEPRTIPAHWDLSGLNVPDSKPNGVSPLQPGEGQSTDRAEG